MEFFKNLYQKAIYYTVSYGDLAFWAVMVVLFATFFWVK